MEVENMQIADMSIYDYLVLTHKQMRRTHTYYKLAGAITSKQVALGIGIGDKTDHDSLMEHVISEIRPDDINYWKRFNHDSVKLYASEYFFGIHPPKTINYQQYKMVEDIISQIRRFEKDYNIKIKTYPEFEEVLEEARKKIINQVYLERNEKIVGTPINEQYLIDSINRELNIENCEGVKDIREVARIISKYYHDSFFKKIIVKVVPNAEKITYFFGELFGYDRYLNDISFNIDDFSYENIEICLQRLLSEIEKKRDAEFFDMMYNDELGDNEEFDRKKEEERHQSLVDDEIKARTDWKKDSSSYELYQNFKKSISDRLEYEKEKDEFDKLSHNQISEIVDNKLDNSNRIR